MLLLDPDTISLLFGEKATDPTMLEWPSSVCRSVSIAESQSRTILSPDPDTISLPSGKKATE